MSRSYAFLFATVLLCASVSAATAPVSAQVPADRLIPVTVRVFDGETFVDTLGLGDFELHESGLKATPEALLLVRKDRIERREGAAEVRPDLARRISLLFRMNEYSAKIQEALEFVFEEALLPTDVLSIQTPSGNYQLTSEAFAAKPARQLARELAEIVRKDIVKGSMAYNSALRDLRRFARSIGGVTGSGGGEDLESNIDDGTSLELRLMHYSEEIQKMEGLRSLEQPGLLEYAGQLKRQPGQRFVYYIYQREFRPEMNANAMNQLMMTYQDRTDIVAALQSLFQMYSRRITMDHELLKQAFADAGAHFNFLFMNKTPDRVSGVTMREQSEDIFKAMSTVAEATGGLVDTSQNPAASIRTAMTGSEAYYLLYYTPSAAAPPGTFMDIEIKVKGGYKVSYRAGYFSGSR